MKTTGIQTEDFDLTKELDYVGKEDDRGGVVFFVGRVRKESVGNPGQAVVSMELSHYPGATEQKLEELRKRTLDEFGIEEVVIKHRIGPLKPGDNIVLVIAAAKHRKEAFDACSWTISELKKTVPFWKKEVYEDGHVWLEELSR